MPRYFFAVESPTHKAEDEQGEELPDDLAAHRAAQQTALELIGAYSDAIVIVRAADGRVVTEVPIPEPLN